MRIEIGGTRPQFAITPYAESVTPGHPDLACNLASDHVLDRAIEASSSVGGRPRVALEVTAKAGIPPTGENLDLFTPQAKELIARHGLVVVVGEITLPDEIGDFNFKGHVVDGFRLAGYNDPTYGFYPIPETVLIAVNKQSADIASGVDIGGAGDQGAMVGFATREASEFMPLAMMVARRLTARQFEMFQEGTYNHVIKPDGKSQVTLRQEIRNGRPVTVGVENVTVAVAHDPLLSREELQKLLLREQIGPVLDHYNLGVDKDTQVVINGTGKPWTIFGPVADAGTENRKLMVQAYGLAAKHGGGGWSGKDPTKVDRSGALFARHVALSLVAGGVADTCEVIVSFSIGRPEPHILRINTFGTNAPGWIDKRIKEMIQRTFRWTVEGIIENLDLFQSWYARTNLEGVFGVSDFPWEQSRELR